MYDHQGNSRYIRKEIFIHTNFTPYKDSINNDFYIRNLQESGIGTHFNISNRCGGIVYESADYNQDNLREVDCILEYIYFYTLYVSGTGTFNGWIEAWRGKQY